MSHLIKLKRLPLEQVGFLVDNGNIVYSDSRCQVLTELILRAADAHVNGRLQVSQAS